MFVCLSHSACVGWNADFITKWALLALWQSHLDCHKVRREQFCPKPKVLTFMSSQDMFCICQAKLITFMSGQEVFYIWQKPEVITFVNSQDVLCMKPSKAVNVNKCY